MQRDIIETTNKAATEELENTWGVVVHCFVRSSMMSVKKLDKSKIIQLSPQDHTMKHSLQHFSFTSCNICFYFFPFNAVGKVSIGVLNIYFVVWS